MTFLLLMHPKGVYYLNEGGNKTLALEYLRRAADLGNRDAQFNYAGVHRGFYGCNVTANMTRALELYRRSADSSHPNAQRELARVGILCSKPILPDDIHTNTHP